MTKTREKNLETVMERLDHWVSRHGNGKYIDEESVPVLDFGLNEEWGIQQARREIRAFAGEILSRRLGGTVLEIGLGSFGSTHYLWRELFDRVVTVEKSHDRLRLFGENSKKVGGKWVLNDGKSQFVIGFSHEPQTIKKTFEATQGEVDLLFIDGDHKYESVLADWLVYNQRVKKGGLIAFHDTLISRPDSCYGVPQLMRELQEGKHDGKPKPLQNIFHSKNLGITFYEQT